MVTHKSEKYFRHFFSSHFSFAFLIWRTESVKIDKYTTKKLNFVKKMFMNRWNDEQVEVNVIFCYLGCFMIYAYFPSRSSISNVVVFLFVCLLRHAMMDFILKRARTFGTRVAEYNTHTHKCNNKKKRNIKI